MHQAEGSGISKRYRAWLLVLAMSASVFVNACSRSPDIEEYRHEEPWPFYLYLPSEISEDQSYPLFIAVHGSSTDGRGCWATWQPFAEEYGYVLMCPVLAEPDGRLHQLNANARLLEILSEVYVSYSLKPAIFLAGFSAGGQFVHGYAFMNPSYVKGVAVMAPGNAYPPPSETGHIPFLVMVGENDQAGNQAVAQQLATMLEQKGYSVEFQVLENAGHSIPDEAVQRTLELFERSVHGN